VSEPLLLPANAAITNCLSAICGDGTKQHVPDGAAAGRVRDMRRIARAAPERAPVLPWKIAVFCGRKVVDALGLEPRTR
jgi:hypothetical protein